MGPSYRRAGSPARTQVAQFRDGLRGVACVFSAREQFPAFFHPGRFPLDERVLQGRPSGEMRFDTKSQLD